MHVIYSDRVRQGGEDFCLLQQVTTRLEDILGKSAAQVTAAWDRTDNGNGRMPYTLSIFDGVDEASAAFARDELQSASLLQSLLASLWAAVLQKRNHRELETLLRTEVAEV